ncbi:hypothetical protein PI126_g15830 [Phytophthora idaei]|nr:hypothetical protein PI126_g15830 [Phytophthora idaei]
MYWWRKEKKPLKEAAKETPNKYFASDEVTKYQYILYPELETRYTVVVRHYRLDDREV